MELFDVVDKNRKKCGYTKIRGSNLLDGEYNTGIEIWIFNDKKLLMTKRSLKKSYPGKWEVPGGCSQKDETSMDTWIREIKEEIGILIDNNDIELIDTTIYKNQFVDIYKSNKIIDLNEVILQKDEVSDIKYVTKEEFLKMARNEEIVASVYNRYNIIKDKIAENW